MTDATTAMGKMLAVVALALLQAPTAHAMDQGQLIACWRDYAEDIGGATRIVLPSGEEGLSWGIDPETGSEIVGMLPYSELCFGDGGTVSSLRVLTDEGLGSSGPYQFDGRILSVRDDFDFPDGWLFGARDAVCVVTFDGDILTLGGCAGRDQPPDMSFVRSTAP